MSRFMRAATAAILSTLPLAAVADGSGSHAYTARQAGTALLVLTTTGAPEVAAPIRSRAQLGTPRLVRLDGVLVEVDEVFLRAQIAAGTYRIVHPESGAPVTLSGMSGRGLLPIWY